jgi:hypothetical protein
MTNIDAPKGSRQESEAGFFQRWRPCRSEQQAEIFYFEFRALVQAFADA